MPRSRSDRLRLAASALGGAALALSLPTPGLLPLGWIGLIPMIAAADAADRKRDAALAAWLAGLAFHAVALRWIYQTCRFAGVPIPVSLVAWGALAAFLALAWPAAALLARRLAARRPALRPLAWAVAWTAVAAACERWTPRLGADLLGHTQYRSLALLQAGSWGGPHLLGFVLVLLQASLAARRIKASAYAAALLLGLWAHGAFTLSWADNAWITRSAKGPVGRVEILQPRVDQYMKWDEASADGIVENYRELLSRPRTGAPALVVWPETALPYRAERGTALGEAAAWARRLKAPQLVGVLARGDGERGPANAAHYVMPDGKVAGLYAKRELVPFGEFVPLRRLIPRFVIDHGLAVLDDIGDIEAGEPDPPLVETPWGPTSVTICYEAMFPRWARRDAARGARLMINVTNDGWYKDTWGPYQHFQGSVFRAIENRITVIRAGNTGVSAVIDPYGRVTASLALNERGRLDAELPLDDPFPGRSFFARHGDWLALLCLALAALGLLS